MLINRWTRSCFINQEVNTIDKTGLVRFFFLFLRTARYLKLSNNSNYLHILRSLDSDVFTIICIKFKIGRWDLAIWFKGCFDPALPDRQYNYRTAADLNCFRDSFEINYTFKINQPAIKQRTDKMAYRQFCFE